MPKPVEVKTPSDREVVVIRTFDVPAASVPDAHTKPELLKRWMLGPPGWACLTAPSTCAWAASTATSGMRTRPAPNSVRTASISSWRPTAGWSRPSAWTVWTASRWNEQPVEAGEPADPTP